MNDHRPHAKSAYYMPLAHRLIADRIRLWLDSNTGIAEASASTEERREGVRWARSYLDEYQVHLVPDIIDQLTRAGLLKPSEAGQELPEGEMGW